jgi:hypothetical protein
MPSRPYLGSDNPGGRASSPFSLARIPHPIHPLGIASTRIHSVPSTPTFFGAMHTDTARHAHWGVECRCAGIGVTYPGLGRSLAVWEQAGAH